MGSGRIPGPYGTLLLFGCVLHPGPLGGFEYCSDDQPYLTPGPLGTGKDLPARDTEVDLKSAEDLEELKLLIKIYGGVGDRKGESYSYIKKGKREHRLEAYIKDRDRYFGSREDYLKYRDVARGELDGQKAKLRKYIEPQVLVRDKHLDWKVAQDTFYSWVRKAYENKLGEKVEVPKLIKAHMSEALDKALKQVRSDYGKNFKAGGFNPRPVKHPGYYLLGTISEHAVGTAIDIENERNAQIPAATWKAILKFTGKSLDPTTAKTKWKTAPRELHETIQGINDAFVSKVATALKAAAAAKDPMTEAMNKNADLKSIGRSFVEQWRNGFFSLPWDLVKELHEEGLIWGATFETVDLHHFQL